MSVSTTQPQVQVGVGIFILRKPLSQTHLDHPGDVEFIIGKRKGSHGAGTWALAGGHLEFDETFEACAAREAAEEVGLEIENIKFLTAVNTVMPDAGKHYVTIFMTAQPIDQNAKVRLMEPDKCEQWKWISWRQFSQWAEIEIKAAETDHHIDESHGGEMLDERLFPSLIGLIKQRPGTMPVL